jgi:peptidyl-prolyl cis-trans isomerase SurA
MSEPRIPHLDDSLARHIGESTTSRGVNIPAPAAPSFVRAPSRSGASARLAALLAFACLAASALGATASHAEPVLIDGIAAQVGTEIVLISEVQELAAPIEERMLAQGAGPDDVRSMYRDALERLIESKLIEGVVKRLELEATDQEIDNAIYGIAQDNGLTIEQLQASVRSHGLTVEEYREKIRGEIERSKVLNAMVRSRVRVEPFEVEALYKKRYGDQRKAGEEVHLRLILVGAGPSSMRDIDTACTIAAEAREKIVAGEIAFGDMAQRVTDMNADAGGELGWLHTDEIAGWMKKPLESMQPGDISPVIPTAFGCNVLQLVERRVFTPVTFEDAEPVLSAELQQQKSDAAYLEWLETLRAQTYVARYGAFNEVVRLEQITGDR